MCGRSRSWHRYWPPTPSAGRTGVWKADDWSPLRSSGFGFSTSSLRSHPFAETTDAPNSGLAIFPNGSRRMLPGPASCDILVGYPDHHSEPTMLRFTVALLLAMVVSGSGIMLTKPWPAVAGIAPPSYCPRGCPGRITISEPPFRMEHRTPIGRITTITTAPITVACMSAIGTACPTPAAFMAIAKFGAVTASLPVSAGLTDRQNRFLRFRRRHPRSQPFDLKNRCRQNRHRDGLMRQSERNRDLIKQRENAEHRLQRYGCHQPQSTVDRGRSGPRANGVDRMQDGQHK